MSWDIAWTEEALKEVDHLDRRTKERILNAIERLASIEHGDVKRLRGHDAEWRLRVGKWRVRFVFHRASRTMTILHVLPRGSAYRD
ncbi:MAG: type II toxin-antitoxin system RelE/ParE family toxin [Chloroflexi bacterium]|nr:type II toxin-antitoxin system RelE/ParE family toxin [Chloroflexota bacterium]